MKSSNTSFLQFRRAVAAIAVLLTTGTGAVLAQGTDTSANTGTAAQTNSSSDYNNTNSSNMSGSQSGMNNETSSSSSMDMSQNNGSMSQSSSNGKLSWSDRHFVEKVAQSNQREIQLAQLAAEKASNPDVKSFAQQMVQDHTKMGQDLQTLAENNNVQLKNEQKEDHEYKKLAALSGNDFDAQFMKRMVSEHKKDVKEFKDRADDAKNPDLKTFAQNQIPTLEHHLQMAQSLESSIVPTGRMDKNSGRSYGNSNDTSSSTNMTGNTTFSTSTGASNAASSTSTGSSAGATTSSTASTQ